MQQFLMLHGINHNMFGKRDPVQYGTVTLEDIDARLQALDIDRAGDRNSHGEYPRSRSVPAQIGFRGDRERTDLRVRD
ncbi:hypothetical protein OKW40_005318 [Paraburkholderia sp. RAU6.4a]